MPLSNFINTSALIDSFRARRRGFGKPLILSLAAELPEQYQEVATRDELLDFGLSSSSAEVAAFEAMTGQARRPQTVGFGRRTAAAAQVHTFTVGGTGDGDYTIPINGIDYTFAASGNTDTEIRDGLVVAINAGDDPVTATPVSTDQLTVTADNAGEHFEIGTLSSPGDVLTGTETTPNQGPYEDLGTLRGLNSTFYAVMELTRQGHNIAEMSRWAGGLSTETAIVVGQANDEAILDAGDSTDVYSVLLALSRARTMGLYKSSDSEYLDAAILGKILPTDPGSVNWAWQAVAEVTADDLTVSEVNALRGKRVGWCEDLGGQALHFEGRMLAPGMWVDLVRGRDKVVDDINAGLIDLFSGADKIGFDELPIVGGRVEAEIRKNSRFVISDSISVEVPELEDISDSDIAERQVLGITWSARIRTPVNTVSNSGTLTISGTV